MAARTDRQHVADASVIEGIRPYALYQGWDYTAQDFEGMRWKIAAELSEDRIWLLGDEDMPKARRLMGVERK